MRKPDKTKALRNGRKEVYTWLELNKYEELYQIAEKSGMTVSTLLRAAAYDLIRKMKRKERFVT